MKVAIVGGTGMLGRQVAQELRARGHEVRIPQPPEPAAQDRPDHGRGSRRRPDGLRRRGRREQRVQARRGDTRRGHPSAARRGGDRRGGPPRRRVDRGLRAGAAGLLPGEGEPGARRGAGTRAVEPGPRHTVPRVHRRVVRGGGPVARATGAAGAAAARLLRRGRPGRRRCRRGRSSACTRDHRRTRDR